ncbi:cell division protein FtsK, partial [Bacillus tropicus]|nr:cell division protein FtsK [Bacillus tropicus]
MQNWFRKTLVALITVFTFGLVTPPSILLDNAKA